MIAGIVAGVTGLAATGLVGTLTWNLVAADWTEGTTITAAGYRPSWGGSIDAQTKTIVGDPQERTLITWGINARRTTTIPWAMTTDIRLADNTNMHSTFGWAYVIYDSNDVIVFAHSGAKGVHPEKANIGSKLFTAGQAYRFELQLFTE